MEVQLARRTSTASPGITEPDPRLFRASSLSSAGTGAASLRDESYSLASKVDLLAQAAPNLKAPFADLPCPFQILNCDEVFTDVREFKIHVFSHFRGQPAPTSATCFLCDDAFEQSENDHPALAWNAMLSHLAHDHYRKAQRFASFRIDFSLMRWMYSRRIISDGEFKRTQLLPIPTLLPDSGTSNMAGQKRLTPLSPRASIPAVPSPGEKSIGTQNDAFTMQAARRSGRRARYGGSSGLLGSMSGTREKVDASIDEPTTVDMNEWLGRLIVPEAAEEDNLNEDVQAGDFSDFPDSDKNFKLKNSLERRSRSICSTESMKIDTEDIEEDLTHMAHRLEGLVEISQAEEPAAREGGLAAYHPGQTDQKQKGWPSYYSSSVSSDSEGYRLSDLPRRKNPKRAKDSTQRSKPIIHYFEETGDLAKKEDIENSWKSTTMAGSAKNDTFLHEDLRQEIPANYQAQEIPSSLALFEAERKSGEASRIVSDAAEAKPLRALPSVKELPLASQIEISDEIKPEKQQSITPKKLADGPRMTSQTWWSAFGSRRKHTAQPMLLDFSLETPVLITDRMKMAVEDYLGASVLWWPLSTPNRKPGDGEMTVAWNCSCGASLKIKLSSTQAEAFCQRTRLVTQSPGQPPLLPTHQSQSSQMEAPALGNAQASTSSLRQQAPLASPRRGNNNVLAGRAVVTPGAAQAQSSQKYLHWCVDVGPTETKLIEFDIRDITDSNLVPSLLSKYQALRGLRSWLTLTSCAGVRLIKFGKLFKEGDHVTYLHDELPCRKTNTEYEYQYFDPTMPEKDFIKIVQSIIALRIRKPNCPETVRLGSVLDYVPKKVNGRMQSSDGYGMYAVSAYCFWKAIVVLFIVSTPSVAFMIRWLIGHKGDWQNALTWLMLTLTLFNIAVLQHDRWSMQTLG